MPRVIVIGGGVIGVACAHYLHEAGCSVLLIDSGSIGGGCSHANCGFVCPSHVLPLAGPGMIGDALRTMLDRDSPLKIRLGFDPSLWWWLFRFARRCNSLDMLKAGRAIQALLNSSRSLYDELFAAGRLDAEWQHKGVLFVFQTQKAMDHYAETDHLLRKHFNLPARRLGGPALLEREPALKPGLAGAWHYERDGHLRPDRLMTSWHRWLAERGIEIREQCVFRGFLRQGNVARGIDSSHGPIAADHVVVATGAWTPLLEKELRCPVPIQPGKGYSVTMPRPSRCPAMPMIFEEHRVAVTPMQSGFRLGSTMEFAGYDASLNRRRLDYLRRAAAHYLIEPSAEPVQEEWWGWRPMVFDGKPIIGRCPKLENVIIAAGHGMLGISMAPGTGKLVTELITGQVPHLDPTPYHPARFGSR